MTARSVLRLEGLATTAFLSLALAMIAFAWTWWCGARGLHLFDQSIVFDGGYRVLSGQVPYRDFYTPTGPAAFWLQAIFFFIGGVTWRAYLAHAAVGASLGALAAFSVGRRLVPESPLAACACSAVTGLALYAPSGTPFFEPEANVLVLCAIAFAVARSDTGRRADAAALACGLLVAGALLVKQTSGLLALPVIVVLAFQRGSWRRLGIAGLGMGLGTSAFAIWLFGTSSPAQFLRYVVTVPAGQARIRLSWFWWFRWLERPYAMLLTVIAAEILLLVVIFAVSGRLLPRLPRVSGSGLLLMLGAHLTLYFGSVLSNNMVTINLGLLGLVLMGFWRLALDLARQGLPRSRSGVELGMAALTILCLAAIVLPAGIDARSMAGPFNSRSSLPALSGLRLAAVTPQGSESFKPADLDGLVLYLKARPGRLFVFPSATILYGLLDRPAPQPFLWFHQGLTFPRQAHEAEAEIIAGLEGAPVEWVVLERSALIETQFLLTTWLPGLGRHLSQVFVPECSFGPFVVLRRRH